MSQPPSSPTDTSYDDHEPAYSTRSASRFQSATPQVGESPLWELEDPEKKSDPVCKTDLVFDPENVVALEEQKCMSDEPVHTIPKHEMGEPEEWVLHYRRGIDV